MWVCADTETTRAVLTPGQVSEIKKLLERQQQTATTERNDTDECLPTSSLHRLTSVHSQLTDYCQVLQHGQLVCLSLPYMYSHVDVQIPNLTQ